MYDRYVEILGITSQVRCVDHPYGYWSSNCICWAGPLRMMGITDFHVNLVELLLFFLVGVRLVFLFAFALLLLLLFFLPLRSSELDFSFARESRYINIMHSASSIHFSSALSVFQVECIECINTRVSLGVSRGLELCLTIWMNLFKCLIYTCKRLKSK